GGHARDQSQHAPQEDHRARHPHPARRRLIRVTPLALPALYAIVDPLDTGRSPIDLAAALLQGGARLLQLRLKAAPAREVLEVAGAVRPLARQAGALLIVNDRPDVARAAGAHRVPLRRAGLPAAAARPVCGAAGLVGVCTLSVGRARSAVAAGADYLGVGPVFETTSKVGALAASGLDLVRAVRAEVTLPLVAIGGITPATAPD